MAIISAFLRSVTIVEARFYQDIADELVRGAILTLDAAGVAHTRVEVPGAFEIPAAIGFALKGTAPQPNGFIALGCIIRGETTHYDYVCAESARGLQHLAVEHGAAIGYGILTVENAAQAWQRARVSEGNKGGVAAAACLRMMELRAEFGLDR